MLRIAISPIRAGRRLVVLSALPILLAALVVVAAGHDLWILPPKDAKVGGAVLIDLSQGMDFPKSTGAPDPTKWKRIFAIGPDAAEVKITPADSAGDFGRLSLDAAKPGVYIVAVETTPKTLTLDAEEFNAYLVSDGMPQVFLERAKDGTLGESSRERYSKSPKMIVKIGDGPGDPTRVLGLTTEIVPLADPFKVKAGGTLPVRVVAQGRPLVDQWLGWDHGEDGDQPSGMVRTDERGEALIPIKKTGLLTLRITSMTHPRAETHEWESFWTTLTVRIPD
jgi:hypothetical protein